LISGRGGRRCAYFLVIGAKTQRTRQSGIRRYLLEESNRGLKPFEYKTSTAAGARWKEEINENLLLSDVLVALIGKKWLALLQDPHPAGDMVRYEIGTALTRGMRVIPMLVAGADLPKREQLPEELSELAACTPFRGDVLKDLEEQICRVKNWVCRAKKLGHTFAKLAFHERVAGGPKTQREQLGIVRFPEFKLPAEQHNIEYPEWLGKFMDEAPPGSWLFTNYPEDELNKPSGPEEDRAHSTTLGPEEATDLL